MADCKEEHNYVADNDQETLIQRVTQAVKSRAGTLASKTSETAAQARTRLLERTEGLRSSRRRLVLVGGGVVVVIALILMVGINLVSNPDAFDQTLVDLGLKESSPGIGSGLLVSGFIEAEEVNLAAEISGRVVELPYDDGDEVETGGPVVQLGSSTLEAELEAASAVLDIALAEQAILETGAREEVVSQTEASLMAAQAARNGAYAAWQDAIALRDNPQEINVRLAEAYTQYSVAQAQTDAAQARFDEAYRVSWLYMNVPGAVDLYLGRGRNPNIAPNERSAGDRAWQAQEMRDSSQAALEGASATLGAFYALRDDPQALQAQVINAEAQYLASEARLMEAQANYDMVLTGATDEQLIAAQANVDQAQAAVERLERQLAKLTITAPTSGVVLDQTVLVGELAVPGVTLVTLADLDEVKLTVFVPADQLDKVSIGQEVRVSVDSHPDRVFDGMVATIANEAEFTPRSVVTREERVSLVFAVEIRLPNPDHALKPGMPADAVLGS
jgi:multidrug efflux pump subunit AcrA (membrane-fusion protein)